MSIVVRPALRWHGGKWRLAPWIIEHMPDHKVYVEPFGGAASVLLRKERSYAEIYNDLDDDLVNLFSILRDPNQSRELERQLRLTPFARTEFDAAYSETCDHLEKARRLIIRSYMGFGSDAAAGRSSGFRANSNRRGTTPSRDWLNFSDAIAAMTERMQGVVIEKRPAIDVIKKHDTATTLHYVDPPYVHETRARSGRKNYRFEMTDEDHGSLLTALKALDGKVILSGYAHEMYESALAGWRRVERKAHADGARERTEVLWMNFPEPKIQEPQVDLFSTHTTQEG